MGSNGPICCHVSHRDTEKRAVGFGTYRHSYPTSTSNSPQVQIQDETANTVGAPNRVTFFLSVESKVEMRHLGLEA